MVGKAADVIAIDLAELETQPLYDPVSQLVYSAGRHQVTDVWVAGRQLLSGRKLTKMDIDDIIKRAGEWQARIDTADQASETESNKLGEQEPS